MSKGSLCYLLAMTFWFVPRCLHLDKRLLITKESISRIPVILIVIYLCYC